MGRTDSVWIGSGIACNQGMDSDTEKRVVVGGGVLGRWSFVREVCLRWWIDTNI